MRRSLKNVALLMIMMLMIGILFVPVQAATPAIDITLSRVGSSTSMTCPGYRNPVTVTGIMVDGQAFIRASHVSTYFPCAVNSFTSYMQLTMNGQTVKAYKNSSFYETTVTYSVYKTPSLSKTYEFFGSGNLPDGKYAAGYFNSTWYVAIDIMKMLGALYINRDAYLDYSIYDFRLNVSPYGVSDNNVYIVGGTWISSGYSYELGTTKPANTSWNGMRLHKLAPNFKINELQDHSNSTNNPGFYTTMKIAKDLLSSAQQIRYELLNSTALNLSCAYRTWAYNKIVGSTCDVSMHMRGRAFDAPEDSLYPLVYNYFKGNHSAPIPIGTSYLRRQPEVSSSYGDEIETMPRPNGLWLHMQVDPSISTAVAPNYP